MALFKLSSGDRMSAIMKRIAQNYVSKLSKEDLSKMTTKTDTLYDNKNPKFGKESAPVPKEQYVHRSTIIVNGYVHFTNPHHRQMIAYYHPWVKGYLEKVSKALFSEPPIFCQPDTSKEEEPVIDEEITAFWAENRLQDAMRKSWMKSQVHGICFYYPMEPTQFFEGYSGPPWYVYSSDEMGEPSDFNQGHPIKWTINHSNKNKDTPKEITIKQGVFYDYKLSDDFTGEPFGIGIHDILIDWIFITDSINSFDQRMGNGFFTMVVPNSTSDIELAKYEQAVRNTRTEKGLVVRGAVEEPVTMNWVGMAGMQVDFIAHVEKLEDLIAFNMGFPKRWIMGDAEGAMESSGKDALQVNIQLKNLFNEWVVYIKRILLFHGKIATISDIVVKPAFEMQLSEEEKVQLDNLKTMTIAAKTWMTINEQRRADGLEDMEGGDDLIQTMETEAKEEEDSTESTPSSNPKDAAKKTDSLETLIDVFTDSKISVRQLADLCNVSPTTISKMRDKFDTFKTPQFKEDDLTIKCDAIQLDEDIYEIEDVPLILPQEKFYENLGYKTTRPKEEIARIFNDPKYPKQFRIGATITDDHTSRVPLEILDENTVGMAELKRIDEQGNIRGNIRYSLKEADRILGKDNFIRQKTMSNENIPTSVALYSRDKPTESGGMQESNLDVRSFVFTRKPRNERAGL